jgi:acyl-homoserine-lactone acylase
LTSHGHRLALALATVVVLLAAASASSGQEDESGSGASAQAASQTRPTATIRRTSHGIPHVLAHDFEGLGYGYGYAFAEDNICTIADSYVTVNAQRSRYFGPDGSYDFNGNGTEPNNLNSDFFYQRIIDDRTIERILDEGPPDGPLPGVEAGVRGYVAGYNRYLRETGVDNLPDPRCRSEEWVKPIDEMDVYRRFYQLGLLASQGVAINGIGSAQPPTPPLGGGAKAGRASQPDRSDIEAVEERLPFGGIGSNAYGLGRKATDNGRGMVLGNPHFPWDGSERFHQLHLTIPGRVNVSGASLYGVPLALIGHTENLAWSHTVSGAFRFTPFELTLVPGSPTTYLVDGQPREMEHDRVTVTVRTGDGTLERRSRTLYSTVYGPVFTEIVGQELFPWTPVKAFAMGDANAPSMRYLNHFFKTNDAQSVEEYDRIHREIQGIPWVNSIAADSSGRAYYADRSIVPHVTDEHAARCNTALGRATFELLRLPVLDGSRSSCDWGSDPDAVQDGIFGSSNLPSIFRSDYVTNSNDSHWLANPDAPLEGFDRIIGEEETARSLRTRLGLVMVRERLQGADGRPGRRFTLKQLQQTVFNNRQHAGELFRDDLVEMCEQNPTIVTASGPVDVSEACPVLENWDVRDDLSSRGAILFRQFVDRVLGLPPETLYDEQFDPDEPVDTPRGLNTGNPEVRRAFGEAVQELRDAGIPLDAPLGDYQSEDGIPIHGGPGILGVFNAINVSFDGARGYSDVPHGSSFVMGVQFTDGCPEARSILTYSQSENPESPYFADQTRMFSDKKWVDMLFCERDIRSDPNLEVTELDAPAGGPSCRGEAATLTGRVGGHVVRGTGGPDVIVARGGRDRIRARGGRDLVCGGGGADRVRGGSGSDLIAGARGADVLGGARGRDTLKGGRGRDDLKGGRGRDAQRGGRARDRLDGGPGQDRCRGGPGKDRSQRCER